MQSHAQKKCDQPLRERRSRMSLLKIALSPVKDTRRGFSGRELSYHDFRDLSEYFAEFVH